MAFFAPRSDSMVRRMRCSRACVSTTSVTSSGTWPSSIRVRTKSKSVCEAEGNATSISLKPMSHSVRKRRSFFSTLIGSKSAWFPSRRSVLIQTGASVTTFPGQRRSDSGTGRNAAYLVEGRSIMVAGR